MFARTALGTALVFAMLAAVAYRANGIEPSPVSPVATPVSCIATVPAIKTIVKEL